MILFIYLIYTIINNNETNLNLKYNNLNKLFKRIYLSNNNIKRYKNKNKI